MNIWEKLKTNKYVVRYRTDYEYRTVVATLLSSVATAAFATYNLLLGLVGGVGGVWIYTLATYYYVLALARLLVLASHRFGLLRRETPLSRQKRDACVLYLL